MNFVANQGGLEKRKGLPVLITVLIKFSIFVRDAIFKNYRSASSFLTAGFFP
jgi:hypothetical protein